MDNKNQPGFFDRTTLMALILMALVWVGWQWYMQTRYPSLYQKNTSGTSSSQKEKSQESTQHLSGEKLKISEQNSLNVLSPEESKALNQKEIVYSFKSEFLEFEVSSYGMGIKNVVLPLFKERDSSLKKMGLNQEKGRHLFSTFLNQSDLPLVFDIKVINQNEFIGEAVLEKFKIIKTITVVPEKYTLNQSFQIESLNGELPEGISLFLVDKIQDLKSSSFFMPQFEKQDFFVSTVDSTHRQVYSTDFIQLESPFKKVNFTSINSQYFSSAFVNTSDILPQVTYFRDLDSKVLYSKVFYPLATYSANSQIQFITYVGPKSFDQLKDVYNGLEEIVDYGFFNFIAKYILLLLKVFYGWFGNWGVAIIFLTLVVRLAIFPLAISSFKSMKRMQLIQPQLKEIRESYKDDPQKMNLEVMRLMKESKANPVSGCLPLLLQFPIFLALYQVIGHSVELYQVPFALWIKDLSLKDPFYILPILMTLTMVIQQKLTPSAMDPLQAKIMMFMPILFCFFMLGLPSGLTLYFFVSTLFAVFQQIFFMRDKTI